MRLVQSTLGFALLCSALVAGQQRGAPPVGPGGRGGGRGAVPVMTLATSAWADGGNIPATYAQTGDEVSPGLRWSHVPA